METENISGDEWRDLSRAVGDLKVRNNPFLSLFRKNSFDSQSGNVQIRANYPGDIFYHGWPLTTLELYHSRAGQFVPFGNAKDISIIALREEDEVPIDSSRVKNDGKAHLNLHAGRDCLFGVYDYPRSIENLCRNVGGSFLNSPEMQDVLNSIAWQYEALCPNPQVVMGAIRSAVQFVGDADTSYEAKQLLRRFDRSSKDIARDAAYSNHPIKSSRRALLGILSAIRQEEDETANYMSITKSAPVTGLGLNGCGSRHYRTDPWDAWGGIALKALEDSQPNVVR